MSHTDNHRPYEVLKQDPTQKRVMIGRGKPIRTDSSKVEFSEPEYEPRYYSGYSSYGGHKKPERKTIRRRLRAHQRSVLHHILHLMDHETADIKPVRGDRRCVAANLS